MPPGSRMQKPARTSDGVIDGSSIRSSPSLSRVLHSACTNWAGDIDTIMGKTAAEAAESARGGAHNAAVRASATISDVASQVQTAFKSPPARSLEECARLMAAKGSLHETRVELGE